MKAGKEVDKQQQGDSLDGLLSALNASTSVTAQLEDKATQVVFECNHATEVADSTMEGDENVGLITPPDVPSLAAIGGLLKDLAKVSSEELQQVENAKATLNGNRSFKRVQWDDVLRGLLESLSPCISATWRNVEKIQNNIFELKKGIEIAGTTPEGYETVEDPPQDNKHDWHVLQVQPDCYERYW